MAEDIQYHRTGETRTSAADLYRFMQRVRAGEPVSPSELLKFAKLFNNELTLDNLERWGGRLRGLLSCLCGWGWPGPGASQGCRLFCPPPSFGGR